MPKRCFRLKAFIQFKDRTRFASCFDISGLSSQICLIFSRICSAETTEGRWLIQEISFSSISASESSESSSTAKILSFSDRILEMVLEVFGQVSRFAKQHGNKSIL